MARCVCALPLAVVLVDDIWNGPRHVQVPFGSNNVVSLNERLGSLDRCQGGAFAFRGERQGFRCEGGGNRAGDVGIGGGLAHVKVLQAFCACP